MKKAAADSPMISCLMVTLDRLELAKLAIVSYAKQSYPSRELVIVSDGQAGFRSALMGYVKELGIAEVRLIYPGEGAWTLGALRNISMDAARGEIICQWDDDDYSHPDRLTIQARHMASHGAAASFFTDHLQYIEPEGFLSWIDWSIDGRNEGIMQLAPGTLMMHRDARFRYPECGPDSRQGEDWVFMESLYASVRLAPLMGAGYLYLYRYHGRNTYSMEHHCSLRNERSRSNAALLQDADRLKEVIRYYPIARPCPVVGREGTAFVLQ
jgi:glycosyltransferase involved in cell wall biosynthesis